MYCIVRFVLVLYRVIILRICGHVCGPVPCCLIHKAEVLKSGVQNFKGL